MIDFWFIIKFLFLITYTSIFLLVLFKYKILVPLKQIKENEVEGHTYYREKIDQYSPLMNAKLLGKDIFDQDVITSMILYLRSKGWQEGQEVDEVKSSKNKFMKNEIAFIKYSQWIFMGINDNNNFKIGNMDIKEIIERIVWEELKNEGFIKTVPRIKYPAIIDVMPFLFILLNIVCLGELTSYNSNMISILLLIVEVIANLLWILIYSVSIHFQLNLRSSLEKEGHIYVNKLNASKAFLKDFSVLSTREIKEEILWESYLRNAIFFDLKGTLDKDANQYYKKIISKYNYNFQSEKKHSQIIEKYIVGILVYGIFIFAVYLSKNVIFGLMMSNYLFFPLIYFYFIKCLYPYN